jgi:hypothetical protein
MKALAKKLALSFSHRALEGMNSLALPDTLK